MLDHLLRDRGAEHLLDRKACCGLADEGVVAKAANKEGALEALEAAPWLCAHTVAELPGREVGEPEVIAARLDRVDEVGKGRPEGSGLAVDECDLGACLLAQGPADCGAHLVALAVEGAIEGARCRLFTDALDCCLEVDAGLVEVADDHIHDATPLPEPILLGEFRCCDVWVFSGCRRYWPPHTRNSRF